MAVICGGVIYFLCIFFCQIHKTDCRFIKQTDCKLQIGILYLSLLSPSLPLPIYIYINVNIAMVLNVNIAMVDGKKGFGV